MVRDGAATSKQNARPGSAWVTVDMVLQRRAPMPLRPRKREPAAPVPSSQRASTVSGLRLPMVVTSLITAYNSSEEAAITRLTETASAGCLFIDFSLFPWTGPAPVL